MTLAVHREPAYDERPKGVHAMSAKRKKRPARRYINLMISTDTQAEIDTLCDLLKESDPIGTRPSKHRAVAIAVREAIGRRT